MRWLCILALCASTTSARAAERLVMAAYPDGATWKVATDKSEAGQHLREQIPQDQVIENYRDILVDQTFANLKAVPPSTFLRGIAGETVKRCGDVRFNGPTEKQEGGHTVAYAQVYCNKLNTAPYGVIMNLKAIQGADALYVINRKFRVPPSEKAGALNFGKDQTAALVFMKTQADANQYLVGGVRLCADGAADAQCAAAP